jgi:hypothetical protein
MTSWRLNAEQQQTIADKIRTFGYIPFVRGAITTYDAMFLEQMKSMLSLSEWVQKLYTGPIAVGQPPMKPLTGAIGILVRYAADKEAQFGEALRALAASLNAVGIVAGAASADIDVSDREALEIDIGA